MSAWVWIIALYFGLRYFGVAGVGVLLAALLAGQWLTRLVTVMAQRARFMDQRRAQLANPADYEARHQLGAIYLRGRRYAKAAHYLEEAHEMMRGNRHADPDPQLMLDCARVRFARGDFAGAAALAGEVADEHPSHRPGDADLLAARAYSRLGSSGEALGRYAKAAARCPSSAEACFRQAQALAADGRPAEARASIHEHQTGSAGAPLFLRRRNRWWRLALLCFPVARFLPIR